MTNYEQPSRDALHPSASTQGKPTRRATARAVSVRVAVVVALLASSLSRSR